jgi:allose kinase
MSSRLALGIDIGGTYIRFGLIDNKYNLSEFSVKETREVFKGRNPIKGLVNYINHYCNNKLGSNLPCAISIGFPSTISVDRRVIYSTPNIGSLQKLQNFAISNELEKVLGVPIFINRDVNFLFLYDIEHYHIDNNGIILGFYFGTGLGNTISIGGKILLGKNGTAGELGHIPVLGKNEKCGCGNNGCLELFASGKYLEKLQTDRFPDTPMNKMFTKYVDEPELITYIDYLSIPIAIEINIFDSDYIIIGGGIVHMPDFPIARLEEQIHKHTRKPLPDQNLKILYSSLKKESGVIGAGIYVHRRLLSEVWR